MEPRPAVFTPTEAAAVLKVDVSTIYRALARGELAAIRIGDTWRIGHEAIYARLNGQPGPREWQENGHSHG